MNGEIEKYDPILFLNHIGHRTHKKCT